VVSRCWVLSFRVVLKALHTEEDGEESDGLFVGRWDCFGKHLLLSVVDLLLNSLPSSSHQCCHVDLGIHILSEPAWYCNRLNHD
jgi:hypothetical protein